MGASTDRPGGATASGVVVCRGAAFAPSDATYPGVSVRRLYMTTVADPASASSAGERLTDLGPVGALALAALWEAGFALEAGPLSTWAN